MGYIQVYILPTMVIVFDVLIVISGKENERNGRDEALHRRLQFEQYHEVFDGEHLIEIMSSKSAPDIVSQDTVLVVHPPEMREELSEYGISSEGLPPTRYLNFLLHDTSSPERIWYKLLPEHDIVRRYDVDDFPLALYFLSSSSIDIPVGKWSPADDLTFNEWLWKMSKRGITITNKYKGAIKVTVHNGESTAPPEGKDREHRLRSGESKIMLVYASQLVTATTVDVDVYEDEPIFLGGWEILGFDSTEVVVSEPPGQSRQDFPSLVQRINSQFSHSENYLRTCSIRALQRYKIPLLVPQLTESGYAIQRIPEDLYEKLKSTYRENVHKQSSDAPFNPKLGDTEAIPATVIDLDPIVQKDIHDVIGPMVAQWSGEEVTPSASFGIHVYHRGNTVPRHVSTPDNHGIEVILHIDRNNKEKVDDWPLEIVTYSGDIEQIPLKPGDMMIYESSRLIHGRPRAYKGESYVNMHLPYDVSSWDYSNGGDYKAGIGTDMWFEMYHPLASGLTEVVGGRGLPVTDEQEETEESIRELHEEL